jgi:PAS domain S-box-containing protein
VLTRKRNLPKMVKRKIGPSIVFPTILISLTFLLMAIGWWTWNDTKTDAYTELANATKLLTSYYDLTFKQRELSLLSVGKRLEEIDHEAKDSIRLHIANQALELYDDLSAMGFADTTGQLLTLTGRDINTQLPNLSEMTETQRSFEESKKSDRLVIGEVYYFNQVNDWIIPIRVPIRNDGELLALNTSAVTYSNLIKNLGSFGFAEYVNIHFINNTYNTTQVYYPLALNQYDSLLHKSSQIYEISKSFDLDKDLSGFEGLSTWIKSKVIGVQSPPGYYDHYVITTMPVQVLVSKFWDRFGFVLLTYFVLIAGAIMANWYLSTTEDKHITELQSERDFSNQIIEKSPALIIGLDPHLHCTYVNPTAQKTLGYAKSESQANTWWHLVLNLEKHAPLPTPISTMDVNELKSYICTIYDHEKNAKTVSWNSVNVQDAKGNLSQILLFGNDQTDKERALRQAKESEKKLQEFSDDLQGMVLERTLELQEANAQLKHTNADLKLALQELKETQDQLIQTEKMASLGILSAGIGHEINNPLNFIKNGAAGLVKILENQPLHDKVTIFEFLNIIDQGVIRASNIVRSLSHFSRTGENMQEPCNIEEIIDHSLTILENRLKYKVTISKSMHHKNRKILGNSGKLHQAILNIITNAEQAIDESGTISITTALEDSYLKLSIADTGKGISSHHMDRIGVPFFTTKEPGEGTGLGLSITYAIIEEHKGSIAVTSKKNKGTTFTIKLPLKADNEQTS